MENYFNYFTEIEECFRRCRGTPTLLSTLDWALIESWKAAGVPLEAVLTGIEQAFHKFARRPQRFRKINGLAYCSQSVLEAAQVLSAGGAAGASRGGTDGATATPFAANEVRDYLERNAAAVSEASQHAREGGQPVVASDLAEVSAALRKLGGDFRGAGTDYEELERRLSALEDKATASLVRAASFELLTRMRGEADGALAPYRRKMSPAQIESLERQFLKKRLFEHHRVPRLSLFYL